jgi:hypothetical protein
MGVGELIDVEWTERTGTCGSLAFGLFCPSDVTARGRPPANRDEQRQATRHRQSRSAVHGGALLFAVLLWVCSIKVAPSLRESRYAYSWPHSVGTLARALGTVGSSIAT